MKKGLLLIVLLIVVIAVSARLPRKPGCQLRNCKKCLSKPFSCDECDRGFFREKVPLGYACRKTCSPGLYSVKGTCVEKQDCPLNCKTCQNKRSCSVCEYGHVLYKGYFGFGMGRCIKKCPSGFKKKVDPMGGNKCVKPCTANCKLCQGRSCSVCERGHALYKRFRQPGRGVCIKKCPTGHKAKVNPTGGKECVRHCTANCKLCQGRSCSVCERGHALYKDFRGRGRGVCVKKCPTGYKAKVNPTGGNECVRLCEHGHALYKGSGGLGARREFKREGCCLRKCPKGYKTVVETSFVRSCVVAHCESCSRGYKRQPSKCARCESGFYRLSVGKPWQQQDFCFSHCPAGYGPKNVKGVAQCQKEPETKHKATTEPFTMPEFTATTEAEPTPSKEPTSEPETTPEPVTEPESTPSEEPTSEPGSSTTSEPSTTPEPTTEPEPMTEPEPTTVFTDFWP